MRALVKGTLDRLPSKSDAELLFEACERQPGFVRSTSIASAVMADHTVENDPYPGLGEFRVMAWHGAAPDAPPAAVAAAIDRGDELAHVWSGLERHLSRATTLDASDPLRVRVTLRPESEILRDLQLLLGAHFVVDSITLEPGPRDPGLVFGPGKKLGIAIAWTLAEFRGLSTLAIRLPLKEQFASQLGAALSASTIRHLDLSTAGLRWPAVKALCSDLPASLRRISLSGNQIAQFDESGEWPLESVFGLLAAHRDRNAEEDGLRGLAVGGVLAPYGLAEDAFFEFYADSPALTELDLSRSVVPRYDHLAASMASLCREKSPSYLDLSGWDQSCAIDSTCEMIGACRDLKTLRLNGVYIPGYIAPKPLSDWTQRGMDISMQHVATSNPNDYGLFRMLSTPLFRRAHRLNLGGNTWLTERHLRQVISRRHFDHDNPLRLGLRDVEFDVAGFLAGTSASLTASELDLGRTRSSAQSVVRLARRNSGLRVFKINGLGLTDDQMAEVLTVLDPAVSTLAIGGNEVGTAALRVLRDGRFGELATLDFGSGRSALSAGQLQKFLTDARQDLPSLRAVLWNGARWSPARLLTALLKTRLGGY
jgi:hypothetical protein